MTTPRIEEMVEEFVHEPLIKGQTPKDWLRQALTQAHQAGIEEAVEKVEHFIWQEEQIKTDNTVRLLTDLKKALQDNK